MSVNGVTSGAANAYDVYAAGQIAAKASEETSSKDNASDKKGNGVVYEPSNETSKDTVTKTYTQNTSLVNKMKADAEAHTQQLQSIVEKLMSQQGQTYEDRAVKENIEYFFHKNLRAGGACVGAVAIPGGVQNRRQRYL